MALQLPPLASLRIFEAAARHQSFKLASEELNVTPSAVSHAIVALESWLGTELFRRSAQRGVQLTAAGSQYLPYVTEALSMIAVGAQRLPGNRSDKRVAISVAPTFAVRFLIPRLKDFRSMHPGISISLDTSHRQMLFAMDGIDLAIRMGRGEWPGSKSSLLFRESLIPVASPDYARKIREPFFASAHVTLIHLTTVEQDWQAWASAAGVKLNCGAPISVDTVQLSMDAARNGLGIAIGRLPIVEDDLQSGRLVQVSEYVVPIETGYWVVSMGGEETRSEIRAFRRWLEHQFGRREEPGGRDAPQAPQKRPSSRNP